MSYDRDFFRSDTIRCVAERMADVIKHLNERRKNKIDTLLSRGSSGCSIASAVLMASKDELFHTFVRKPHENTHGNSEYAGMFGTTKHCVIVDDFIATGTTVNTICKFAKTHKLKVEAILLGAGGYKYSTHTVDDGTIIKVYNCG